MEITTIFPGYITFNITSIFNESVDVNIGDSQSSRASDINEIMKHH